MTLDFVQLIGIRIRPVNNLVIMSADDSTENNSEGGMSIGLLDVVLFVSFVVAISGVLYSRVFRKKKEAKSTLSLSVSGA